MRSILEVGKPEGSFRTRQRINLIASRCQSGEPVGKGGNEQRDEIIILRVAATLHHAQSAR